VSAIQLAAVPASVSAARRFVRDHAADLPVDLREMLELCVSELAPNCVIHAASGFTIRMSRDAASVRVEVIDAGRGRAQVRSTTSEDVHGRGLQIVSQLAQSWGTSAVVPPPGKIVWFEFAVPVAA
jgi:YD repeat-containing protein